MRGLCLGVVCLGWALAGQASAACHVEHRADIPVTLAGGQLLAAGRIDGQPVTFLIDTGAERTVLSEAAARRLGLARDEWVSSHMQGIGGAERHPNAKLRTLELGGLALRRRGTEIAPSLAVAPLAFLGSSDRPIDGLLGVDYLANFDIAFDPGRGRMTLYGVAGCAGNFLPWTIPYTALAARNPVPGLLLLTVWVNASPVLAQIDTGSTRSVLSLPAALRAGVTQAMLERDPQQQVRGAGASEVTAYEHRFAELKIGPDDLHGMQVLVMKLPARGGGMLLGMDWLGARRLWISWATNQVFVGR